MLSLPEAVAMGQRRRSPADLLVGLLRQGVSRIRRLRQA
jgi:hypothetical protein